MSVVRLTHETTPATRTVGRRSGFRRAVALTTPVLTVAMLLSCIGTAGAATANRTVQADRVLAQDASIGSPCSGAAPAAGPARAQTTRGPPTAGPGSPTPWCRGRSR
jgi:hypothetical protein